MPAKGVLSNYLQRVKVVLHVAVRQGYRKVMPLQHVASHFGEKQGLLLGLDALGRDFHIQLMAKHDNGADDGRISGFTREMTDKALVHLDLVDGKQPQIRKTRIAGAEVVQ